MRFDSGLCFLFVDDDLSIDRFAFDMNVCFVWFVLSVFLFLEQRWASPPERHIYESSRDKLEGKLQNPWELFI